MSARWKAIELEVCRMFGGKRSGPTGKEQAERDAGGDLATLVLHRKGDAVRDSLVIFRLRGFAEWYL